MHGCNCHFPKVRPLWFPHQPPSTLDALTPCCRHWLCGEPVQGLEAAFVCRGEVCLFFFFNLVCRAYVETVVPHSHVHPFGPFHDRLARGSCYGMLFANAFSLQRLVRRTLTPHPPSRGWFHQLGFFWVLPLGMILSPSRAAFPTEGKIGGRGGGIRTTDAKRTCGGRFVKIEKDHSA